MRVDWYNKLVFILWLGLFTTPLWFEGFREMMNKPRKPEEMEGIGFGLTLIAIMWAVGCLYAVFSILDFIEWSLDKIFPHREAERLAKERTAELKFRSYLHGNKYNFEGKPRFESNKNVPTIQEYQDFWKEIDDKSKIE